MKYTVHVFERYAQRYEVEAVDPDHAKEQVDSFLSGDLKNDVTEGSRSFIEYDDPENWQIDDLMDGDA